MVTRKNIVPSNERGERESIKKAEDGSELRILRIYFSRMDNPDKAHSVMGKMADGQKEIRERGRESRREAEH